MSNHQWLSVFVTSLCSITQARSMPCQPTDACSCTMKNGDSVSLWPIDDPDGPRFQNVSDARLDSNFRYEYSPCTPFTYHTKCKDVLVCQSYTKNAYLQYVIGKPDSFSTAFVNYAGKSHLTFRYNGDGRRHTRIVLICDENAVEPALTEANETVTLAGSIYTFFLTSKHACLKRRMNPTPKVDTKSGKIIILLTICVSILILLQFLACTLLGTVWCRYFKGASAQFLPRKLSEEQKAADY